MKHEWKKDEKGIYMPKDKPMLVTVPKYNYFMINGKGNPNGDDFASRIEVLYSLSYSIKMLPKKGFIPGGYFDYTVYPLEGIWDGSGTFNNAGKINKDELIYTLMIRQPEFVTEAVARMTVIKLISTKPHPLINEVKFGTIEDGMCVQLMHTGSYDDEIQSFQKMQLFMEENGFKGIFVASGAGLPRFMNIKGENLVGVMSSNEYLTRVNLMDAANPDSDTPVYKGKKVAVIGGGNTAMDSVRTARRLGAEKAMIVYRRSEEEMPARLEEVKHAKEEGIEFLTLHNPIEYIGNESGRVTQMVLQLMELGEPDASGRRSPVEISGKTKTIEVDEVIVSVGVSPNPLIKQSVPELETTKWGTLVVNQDTMQSVSMPVIFAGGDIVRGGATVILAMGDGRRAAKAMDEWIKSKG